MTVHMVYVGEIVRIQFLKPVIPTGAICNDTIGHNGCQPYSLLDNSTVGRPKCGVHLDAGFFRVNNWSGHKYVPGPYF